jgi:hypothetical protein
MVKMFFVSFWLGFGVALFWIHRRRERLVCEQIPQPGAAQAVLLYAWMARRGDRRAQGTLQRVERPPEGNP